MAVPTPKLCTVPYASLADPESDLSAVLVDALGPEGLGVVAVGPVPDSARATRRELLGLARQLATLPPSRLATLEDPASQYNIGWSCGQETLAGGEADRYKGSFYANPTLDEPARCSRPGSEPDSSPDPSLMATHPAYFRPNIWPDQDLPALQHAFKDLTCFMYNAGLLLAGHCDRYLARLWPGRCQVSIHDVISSSRNHKARLLHYYPSAQHTQTHTAQLGATETASGKPDSQLCDQDEDMHSQPWCAWHTDHGSLTGLTRALYLDSEGTEVTCPDPQAGLYVRTRAGQVVKVDIPPDHIAFQVGEALQVHSGGALMATPHYVRAAQTGSAPGINRNTLAVFLQPDVTCPLEAPQGVDTKKVSVGQWRPGQTFGSFASATLNTYYKDTSQHSAPTSPTNTTNTAQLAAVAVEHSPVARQTPVVV